MKTLKLTILLFLSSSAISSQQLSGLWMGELVNDSTQKKQRFELALSEYKGKVTGYSYTTFIENDTFYYSIKRMKATREDSEWTVEDDEMVANNFPVRAAKGVRQINTFLLSSEDSTWKMDGTWKTRATKKYYSLSGSIQMHEEKELSASSLIAHLKELSLANTVAFYQPEKMEKLKPIDKSVIKNQPVFVPGGQKDTSISGPKPELNKLKPVVLSANIETKKHEPATPKTTNGLEKKEFKTADVKPVVIKNNPEPKIALEENKHLPIKSSSAITFADNRKMETIQTVFFKNDSLFLSLYDNGLVDGDSVSVSFNGQIILSKQKLSERATKHTISITQDMPDSMQLILYAENLGTIPPNTGLLVIHDGDDVYNIRFSADLQKNAAIVFRRKQK